jgi:phage terminase large subunit-like protein
MTLDAPLAELPSLDDVRRERYRRSFYAFLSDFWEIVEPAMPFMPAKHLEVLCEHFQAVYECRIKKLNVEIGPGYAKSMVMSVFGPAWIWGPAGSPGFRIIASTQEHGLTIRDSLRFRSLIYSPEYQALWGRTVRPMVDNNKQDYIENTAKGFRVSKSVKGKSTGHRGHMVITDDTLDATEAQQEAAREFVRRHLKALSSRRVDPKSFRWINIGQRLHEEDAGGWCREQGFETLCLPSEYDPSRHCATSLGFSDWRTERGELLFPSLYGRESLEEAKRQLGPSGYSAQHQQLPVPAEGGIIKGAWFQHYEPTTPPVCAFNFFSVDTAQGQKVENDTAALSIHGVHTNGIALIDGWSGRKPAPQFIQLLKDFANKHEPACVVIEAKDWGKALIQLLEHDPEWRWRVVPYMPLVSKDMRAHEASPFFFQGKYWLPSGTPLTEQAVSQLIVFPAAKIRDLADSIIQAALHAQANYTFSGAGYSYEGSSSADEPLDEDEHNDSW